MTTTDTTPIETEATAAKKRALFETRDFRVRRYNDWKDSRQDMLETISELKPLLAELTDYIDILETDRCPEPTAGILAKLVQVLAELDTERQTVAYFSALERRATEATDMAYEDLYGKHGSPSTGRID